MGRWGRGVASNLVRRVGEALPVPTSDRNEFVIEDLTHPTLVVVFDACRYDSFVEAYDGRFPSSVERAYSHAMWTIPSHEAIVRGGLPYNDRTRPDAVFRNDYPKKYFPLSRLHPYSFGLVSIPMLADIPAVRTTLCDHFDDWQYHPDCDELLAEAVEYLQTDEPFFGLLNCAKTHFPYGYDMDWDDLEAQLESGEITFEELQRRQVEACEELIADVDGLRRHVPEGTQVILTADHGDLFGEEGSFGHNPRSLATFDPKAFEVALLSWVE